MVHELIRPLVLHNLGPQDGLFEKALKILSEEDQGIIRQNRAQADIQLVLDGVYKSAKEKQTICDRKQWRFSYKNHHIVIRDVAAKISSSLAKIVQIGDIAVNVDPLHAGLPWAGIRLLLQVVISDSHVMGSLLVGLKVALDTIDRLKAYIAYLESLPSSKVLHNFERSLVDLYALILQFLASAIRTYGMAATKRVWKSFWKNEEILDFETRRDKLIRKVEDDAQSCDRQLTNQGLDSLHKKLEELGRLQDIEESIVVLSEKIDLYKLPVAEGAKFDSHKTENEPKCLPNTRVDLQQQISDWSEDPDGKCIFWLNGSAGTGKSTISRTMSQSFEDEGLLGASFFFKRGENDRERAEKFVTTIAYQLVIKMPEIGQSVAQAISRDASIVTANLRKQFKHLIFEPLSVSSQISRLVIVIDALDECEEEGIQTIIDLLKEFEGLSMTTQKMHLRIFVTSRPELPIRLGFKKISKDTPDLVLHEIPKETIEQDISTYLMYEFEQIKANHRKLSNWPPDHERFDSLVQMAVPLFIVAATACRFISDRRYDPQKRLTTILEGGKNYKSRYHKIYQPILDQLLDEEDSEEDEDTIIQEFKEVVGTIITLADPLSIISLANLLDIDEEDIHRQLDFLHSVLYIPTNEDDPVRIHHLSFRDFLLGSVEKNPSRFHIDESEAHGRIATKCLELISKPGCLKQNLCDLKEPGISQTEVDRSVLEMHLPAHVQYACRYWAYHFERGKDTGLEDGIYKFLSHHFLHWLEALSWLGKISECILAIDSLESCISATGNPQLHEFIHDAKLFVLHNRGVEQSPLQIYCSALFFSPDHSVIRKTFGGCIPAWVHQISKMQPNWSPILQTMDGHGGSGVAFSPDNKVVISSSVRDHNVRIWDSMTGQLLQEFSGHSERVEAVAVSSVNPNYIIASGSSDKTVRLWNQKGKVLQTLESPSIVGSIAFSPIDKIIASVSDTIVYLWNIETGQLLRKLEGHPDSINTAAFSKDGSLIASGSDDGTIRIWDVTMTEVLRVLEAHTWGVNAVAFSVRGDLLASGSTDKTIRLWNPMTGEMMRILSGHSGAVLSTAFAPNKSDDILASGSYDNTIRFWDVHTGQLLKVFEGSMAVISSLAFSNNGEIMASGSWDEMIRLWDISSVTVEPLKRPQESQGDPRTWGNGILGLYLSPDLKLAASLFAEMVGLWDATSGELLETLSLEGVVSSDIASFDIAFSHDSKTILALKSTRQRKDVARIWDAKTYQSLSISTENILRTLLEESFAYHTGTEDPPAGEYFISDNWIRRSRGTTRLLSQDILWLPPDYSPPNPVTYGTGPNGVICWGGPTTSKIFFCKLGDFNGPN